MASKENEVQHFEFSQINSFMRQKWAGRRVFAVGGAFSICGGHLALFKVRNGSLVGVMVAITRHCIAYRFPGSFFPTLLSTKDINDVFHSPYDETWENFVHISCEETKKKG